MPTSARHGFAGWVVAHGNANQTVTMTLLGNDGNTWSGQFRIPLTHRLLAWELKIEFNNPVSNVKASDGDWKVNGANGGRSYTLVNKFDHGFHQASDVIQVNVTGSSTAGSTHAATANFVDLTSGPQTTPVVPATPAGMQITDFNYIEVLEKSLLFYEAQRSGKLPANNRIPWRGDSALDDKGNNNEDLSGGYYDAGDLVKFNFPMAHTVALLASGYLHWTDAYTSTGLDGRLRDMLKWGLDYFLKCHVAEHELYVQVGDPDIDHPVWGRPENMTMRRPSYKITESHPGSDVAAETAAAMAAGNLVFKFVDPQYADTLLIHARQLFDFAINFPGKYTDSLHISTYATSDYKDEVFWAASWLYKATGDDKYRDYALGHKTTKPYGGPGWEDKTNYADALLFGLTNDPGLRADIETAMAHWLPGGTVPYTPSGFVFAGKWGSLRNAANDAYVTLQAADAGLNNATYLRCWVKRQIEYALGRNPDKRSYVVGFGNNPPAHYHHRPSSCPNMIAPCGYEAFNYPGPNPQILYGGLVGGPGLDDSYADVRGDYVKNEVALDYNAAFQNCIAALIHLALHNELPTHCG